jgi:hypothetical protein
MATGDPNPIFPRGSRLAAAAVATALSLAASGSG